MPLTRAEAQYLRDGGTELRLIDEDERRSYGVAKPGFRLKFYQLDTDCGYLDQDTNRCTQYEERPQVCRTFDAGTVVCQKMKERHDMVVDLGIPSFPPASYGMPSN